MSPSARTRGKRVIVVGAGLGGLSAAVSLAAEGFEVEILEKNDRVGGKLNFKEIDGFGFDLGPSIFTLPQFFEDLWKRAGKRMEDYVRLQSVSPHWRNFFEDGLVLDLYEEEDRMKAELAKLGGDLDRHWSQFCAFLEYGREQYDLVNEGYFAKGLDNVWEMLRYYGWRLIFKMDHRHRMAGAIERRIEDPHLRLVFEYFIKYVGSSAKDAPGYMNLMSLIQFDYGLWYVEGGMYNLARGLERLASDLGISLRLGAEVESIDRRASGREVAGVTLKSGEALVADYVVCNMEVIPAYRRLLHEPASFLKKLEKFEPSCSGLVIHLGTDRIYEQLAHHNFFYSKDQGKHFDSVFQKGELPEDPTIYLVAPTRTDPSKAPVGHDNLKILPHIPPIHPEHPHTHEDYLALKERVLDKLERMGLEGLREHTVVEDFLTPADLEAMYYSNAGSIYGVVSDWEKNQAFKAPKQSSKYRNLFFTGGSVNPGGGMPMAILCGQKVADRVLARERRGG